MGETRVKAVTGKRFIEALYQAGIIGGLAQRVVIDADYSGLVRVYVQTVGTGDVLDAVLESGLQIEAGQSG